MTRIGGTGVGWRPEIAAVLDATEGLGFCEFIAESIAPANVPAPLAELGRRGAALVPHGVRLSLGGTDPVAPERVAHLVQRCPEGISPPVMLERDGRYPPAAEMRAELGAIAHVAGHLRPRARDGADPGGGTDAPPSAHDRTPPPSAAPPVGVPHAPRQVRHAGAGCAGGDEREAALRYDGHSAPVRRSPFDRVLRRLRQRP